MADTKFLDQRDNRIGEHRFVHLDGAFVRPTEEIEVYHRPAIDGIGLRKRGKRGSPFRMISTTILGDEISGTWDAAAVAQDAINSYKELIGTQSPHEVVRHGAVLGDVWVLDVEELERPMPGGKILFYNSLIGAVEQLNSGVILISTWTLIADIPKPTNDQVEET